MSNLRDSSDSDGRVRETSRISSPSVQVSIRRVEESGQRNKPSHPLTVDSVDRKGMVSQSSDCREMKDQRVFVFNL